MMKYLLCGLAMVGLRYVGCQARRVAECHGWGPGPCHCPGFVHGIKQINPEQLRTLVWLGNAWQEARPSKVGAACPHLLSWVL